MNISAYDIGQELGRGAFGVVFAAIRKYDKKRLAIKRIDKNLVSKGKLLSRVNSEIKIHSSLTHDNIIKLYAVFSDLEFIYIVLESGATDLFRYIQTNGPFSEAQLRPILKELVNGLNYLHNEKIIHRDLKLSNLLLSNDCHVKIADFGLAVRITTIEQKTLCGTPNYISPEIIKRQPYGLSSDVWSLGCLIVTLLTGSPPFESDLVQNTLQKVANIEFECPQGFSDEIRDLINVLLQKDPSRRPLLGQIINHRFFDPKLPSHRLYLSINNSCVDSGVSFLTARTKGFDNCNTRGNNSLYKYNSESNRDALKERNISSNRNQSSMRGITDRAYANSKFINNAHNDLNIANSNLTRSINSERGARSRAPPTNCENHDPLNRNYSRQSYLNESADDRASNYRYAENAHRSSAIPNSIPLAPRQPSLLDGFTTVRLKALTQSTKYGPVSILPTGDVLLDFSQETFLILISGNSDIVELYSRSSSPLDPNSMSEYSYHRNSLPEGYHKKFKYGARFVELVKSKTPKAKCILMENQPPNCQINFYNGVKVVTDTRSSSLSISDPSTREDYRIDMGKRTLDIPTRLVPFFKHAQDCLQQCLEIEKNTDCQTKYPLILKNNNSTPVVDVNYSQAPLSTCQPSSITHTANTISTRPQSVYIKDVGWCTKDGDYYTMMYCDGAMLVIESREQVVFWRDVESSVEERLAIDRGLAAHVKFRLAAFPKFIKMFL